MSSSVRVMIATPMYGMRCHGPYLQSVLSLTRLGAALGFEVSFSAMCNESLLQRSRNYLADQFLRSGHTHLLFVDADIAFRAEDVVDMLRADKGVIGAAYSNKQVDWEAVARAVEEGCGNLARVAGTPDVDLSRITSAGELTETDTLKTGFVLIRRDVLEKITVAYPEHFYKPDHPGMTHFDGTRRIQMFYSLEIDPLTRELVPEYEFFCRCWRRIGGKLHLLPTATPAHIGTCHAY